MLSKKNLITAVIFITAFFLLFKSCRTIKQLQEEKIISEKYMDSVLMSTTQSFNYKINKLGDTIIVQKAIITESQEVINKISKDFFNLKNKDEKNLDTKVLYRQYTTTKIDTINLVYKDTVAVDTVNYTNIISVPRHAIIDSPNYTIKEIVTNKGVQITELTIPDTLNLRVVEHKKGFLFFKHIDYEFQSYHSNPIIKTTGENSMFYTPKKKTLLSKILPITIAFVAGMFLIK